MRRIPATAVVLVALLIGACLSEAKRRDLQQEKVKPMQLTQPGATAEGTGPAKPVLPPERYANVMARNTYTKTGKFNMPSEDVEDMPDHPPTPDAAAVPKPGAKTTRGTPKLVWPGPIKGEQQQLRPGEVVTP